MARKLAIQLMNVLMRGTTMGSRFLLTFALARYLEPSDLGLYGLIGATIAIGIYVVGLDFYAFTTREIVRSEKARWGNLLKSHAALTLVLYGVSAPLFLLLFLFGVLPWSIASWLVTLLALEHISREIGRILIAAHRQLIASALMFLQRGFWALFAVLVMYFDNGARTLLWVLSCWAIASCATCIVGAWTLYGMNLGGWHDRVDWQWIWKGVRVSITLLMATLALQSIYSVDKYWELALAGPDALGAYVLFTGMAVGMSSVLDAGVFSFAYPALIAAHQNNTLLDFQREMRRMLIQTICICLIFSVAVFCSIDLLLRWIGKPIYLKNEAMLPWVLLGTFFVCVSYSPHYGLYARGQDRSIVVSHLVGAVFFVLVTLIMSLARPDLAVPVGLCCASGCILILKSFYYIRSNVVA